MKKVLFVILLCLPSAYAGTPSFRSESHVVGTGTSPTLSEPSGVIEGDVYIAFAAANNTAGLTKPSGWTTLFSGTFSSVMYTVDCVVRGSSAPSLTWTVSGSVFREVYLQSYKDAAPTCNVPATGAGYVIDSISASGSTSASAQHPDPPATTSVGPYTLAVAGGMNFAGAATWTAPTGYTMNSFNSTTDCAVASKTLSVAGSENPGTFTGDGIAGNLWNGFTLTLAPKYEDTPPEGANGKLGIWKVR